MTEIFNLLIVYSINTLPFLRTKKNKEKWKSGSSHSNVFLKISVPRKKFKK